MLIPKIQVRSQMAMLVVCDWELKFFSAYLDPQILSF